MGFLPSTALDKRVGFEGEESVGMEGGSGIETGVHKWWDEVFAVCTFGIDTPFYGIREMGS